uniref:NAC domain-containing protein n=2 Tax=Oryza brachyantha TaxID=4533 RepID=J3LYW8_ORYBR
MDGSSSHFFHRISNAYGSGQRKRRKISHHKHSASDENIRWHKTGKSKEIYHNGVKKGWKKILVLYKGSKRDKIEQANWVMHQYNLGVEEDEKNGEFVVCKVFFQSSSKQTCTPEMDSVTETSDALTVRSDPITPITNPPQPLYPVNSPCDTEQNVTISHNQEGESSISTLRAKVEPENPGGCSGTGTSTAEDFDESPPQRYGLRGDSVPPLEEEPFPELDLFNLADFCKFSSQDSFSWADGDQT